MLDNAEKLGLNAIRLLTVTKTMDQWTGNLKIDLFNIAKHLLFYANKLLEDIKIVSELKDFANKLERFDSRLSVFLEFSFNDEILSTEKIMELLENSEHLATQAKQLAQASIQGISQLMVSYPGRAHTIQALNKAKQLLMQADYFAWKNNLLSLPSSFPGYSEIGLFDRDNEATYLQANRYYNEGIQYFNKQSYENAITKLDAAVQLYSKFPDNIALANACFYLGAAYTYTRLALQG